MWEPNLSIELLKSRNKFIKEVRNFFDKRDILEVDTPILSSYGVTDVNLNTFSTFYNSPYNSKYKTLYMITSPEYHMKRILAKYNIPIYQVTKVFRNEEEGVKHNPEFTMLEWYRPGFDMFDLISEIEDLMKDTIKISKVELMSYTEVFEKYFNIDPISCDINILKEEALKYNYSSLNPQDRDSLLEFLFSIHIEPKVGNIHPIAVYNFPATQASLARVDPNNSLLANRFEIYYKGVELANGFNELTNYKAQLERFKKDNIKRSELNLPEIEIDINLIEALKSGMKQVSGVAIGLDRLIMIALDKKSISEVLSFPIDKA
ncbi:MAG: elongation factor P--(R)-beta-lysine ligase [Psittacicella sp.]